MIVQWVLPQSLPRRRLWEVLVLSGTSSCWMLIKLQIKYIFFCRNFSLVVLEVYKINSKPYNSMISAGKSTLIHSCSDKIKRHWNEEMWYHEGYYVGPDLGSLVDSVTGEDSVIIHWYAHSTLVESGSFPRWALVGTCLCPVRSDFPSPIFWSLSEFLFCFVSCCAQEWLLLVWKHMAGCRRSWSWLLR